MCVSNSITLARALAAEWGRMREEVAGTDVAGPLDVEVGEAGRGVELRLQHHITRQREQVWADALHRDRPPLKNHTR